jgi:hypothetical protein
MNPKKFRGWCLAGCGGLVKRGATKYCSPRCLRERQRAIREADLEAGRYSALSITTFLRRYLIVRLGERCARCGWSERHPVTNKVPIEVEHIDGNWRNYRLENLTLLCPNCHSLTPTFRALNRGKGREHRLGGRENPIVKGSNAARPALPVTRESRKVFEAPSPQLTLLPPT